LLRNTQKRDEKSRKYIFFLGTFLEQMYVTFVKKNTAPLVAVAADSPVCWRVAFLFRESHSESN
jgi:hypothetical protein